MPILSRAVGVTNFKESTKSRGSEEPRNVDFLGHNGPVGLGDRAEDPCAKIGNRYFGDPDFTEAIAQTRAFGKTIP